MTARRFPAPWSAEVQPLSQKLATLHFEVSARRAGDGISRLHPRRISGFEFQAK